MFSLSVAFDINKGIGINGSLPWHIKEELALFKQNTLHHNIIMGKTTYKGLPNKLKDRNIYVVTSQKEQIDDVIIINDLDKFLKENVDSEIEYIICGGASIYKQAYPYCKKAYVSLIKGDFVTDTSFKCFDRADWNIIESKEYDKFTYYNLERK